MFRSLRRRLFRFVAVSGAGAAAAYFFDPDRGQARRTQARDQADALIKRRQGNTQAPAWDAANVYGSSAASPPASAPRPADGVEALQV